MAFFFNVSDFSSTVLLILTLSLTFPWFFNLGSNPFDYANNYIIYPLNCLLSLPIFCWYIYVFFQIHSSKDFSLTFSKNWWEGLLLSEFDHVSIIPSHSLFVTLGKCTCPRWNNGLKLFMICHCYKILVELETLPNKESLKQSVALPFKYGTWQWTLVLVINELTPKSVSTRY